MQSPVQTVQWVSMPGTQDGLQGGGTPQDRGHAHPTRALKTRTRAAERLLWPAGPEWGRKFRTAQVSVRQEGPGTQLLTAEQQGLAEFQLLTPEPHTPTYRALQSFLNSRARILCPKTQGNTMTDPITAKWLSRLTSNTNTCYPSALAFKL